MRDWPFNLRQNDCRRLTASADVSAPLRRQGAPGDRSAGRPSAGRSAVPAPTPLLVKFAASAPLPADQSAFSALQARLTKSLGDGLYVLSPSRNVTLADTENLLRTVPDVLYVTPDATVH